MGKKKKGDIWIPLWVDKWLFGSTRLELNPDERGVWVDLMALSAKDEGWVRANEGMPYREEQLAGMFVITVDLLRRTVAKAVKYGKLRLEPDGTMYLLSRKEYELSKRHKRRLSEEMSGKVDTMSGKADTMSGKADTRDVRNSGHKSRVDKSKIEKRGEEETTPSFSDFTQKEKNEAVRLFVAAWQELHGRRWETPDDYLPSGFEKRDLRSLLTPGNLEKYITYAYHYHHDNGVGIKPGEKAATIDSFLNKAVPGYCSTLREGTTEWEQATGYAREFLAERASR